MTRLPNHRPTFGRPITGNLPLLLIALAIAAGWDVRPASAQQATFTPAAVQPSSGVLLYRQLARYQYFQSHQPDDEYRIHQARFDSMISYGLTGDLSLNLNIPVIMRTIDRQASEGEEVIGGIGDMTLLGQYRFWQYDSGPTDTTRMALLFGAEIPSFITPLSSESLDPILGVALTHIAGRHSINAGLRWKFNTGSHDQPMMAGDGPHDALLADVNYLFRLSPEAFGPDTTAATYFVAEWAFAYETNGATEGRIGLGILYEATTWAAEIAVQFPVWQDLRGRPDLDLQLVVGVRFFF